LNNLEKLLYLRGISAHYFSYSGELLPVKWDDRLQLLQEVGVDPSDHDAVTASIYEIDAKPWLSWLQPVHIITSGRSEYIEVRVSPDEYDQMIDWKIVTEKGNVFKGDFIPAELQEIGDYHIDQSRFSARKLPLKELPSGYHLGSLHSAKKDQEALLVVAPDSCFKGEPEKTRVWGINCQLYTLRSERNWGVGDFSDLQELIGFAAGAGVDLISLNPLHAPDTSGLDIASPYSPSDRRFLNPLYIDPEQEPEFAEVIKHNRQVEAEINEKLPALRDLDLVDYAAVATLKYSIYDCMFQSFIGNCSAGNSEREDSFNDFVQRHGRALVEFSNFESRHCGLSIPSASNSRFHQYLQWLADRQLENCQANAKNAGMRIGLMRDLAVGAVRGGAEVSSNPALYCRSATIGAPPDPLAEQGQNWNLPALDPVALKASGYQPYIDLLRANMKSCGGLRIDHILGMLRLWWCHPDIENGAYVYYPFEELLAILCLESHRNNCLVVGEDMGTVPTELRTAMKSRSIYSNKIFYFEKNDDHDFEKPLEHQRNALLMVTNHDVPTLSGWWDGNDLRIRGEIGLMKTEQELSAALEQRSQDKRKLLTWLETLDLLPDGWSASSSDKEFDFELCAAIVLANARSRSCMVQFQLDDLQLLKEPVNIPGTYKQYPNWRRKQKMSIREIFGNSRVQKLLSSVQKERSL